MNSSRLSRRFRWGAAFAWAGWALSVGLLLLEHWLWVLHPWSLLFIGLVVVTCGAAVTTLALGLWRILRGPQRSATLAWVVVALLPLLTWASMAYYAYRNGQKRSQPHDLPMTLMTRVGHNLMEAEAIYLCPSRLESARLVMFYDAKITDPEGDLRAMDQALENH